MRATAKCSNPDCKKYDMSWRVPMDKWPLESMYCDNCLIGKLQIDIHLKDNHDEELTAAEFNVLKIFNRQEIKG